MTSGSAPVNRLAWRPRENTVNIGRGTSIEIGSINAIRQETANIDEVTIGIHGRHSISAGRRGNESTVQGCGRIRNDDYACAIAPKRSKCVFDLFGGTERSCDDDYPQQHRIMAGERSSADKIQRISCQQLQHTCLPNTY